MVRLDQSIESQIAYNRRRSIWPPQDLQIDSSKLAKKTTRFISNILHRGTNKKNPGSDKNASNSTESTREALRLKPRRALTIQEEQQFELQDSGSSQSQSQSPLFRLPRNIRQRIYEHVLGNSNVHVISTHGGQRLSHKRCKCATCPGFAFFIERGKWKREWMCEDFRLEIGSLTPLLQTCRKIYSEAVGLMYRSNTFSLKNPKVLKNFVDWIPEKRWGGIMAVHVDVDLQGAIAQPQSTTAGNVVTNTNPWDTAFVALAKLPNLQTIEIRIHPPTSESQTPALSPQNLSFLSGAKQFQQLKNLESCRFYLLEGVEPEEWMREAPFEIKTLKEWEWKPGFTRRPLMVF